MKTFFFFSNTNFNLLDNLFVHFFFTETEISFRRLKNSSLKIITPNCFLYGH